MSTTHLDTGSTGSTSGISGGSSSSSSNSNSNSSEFEIDSWYMQEFEAYNIKTINDSVVIIKKMVKKIKALIDENAKLQSNVTKLNAKLEDISKFIDDPNFLKFIKTESSVDHLQSNSETDANVNDYIIKVDDIKQEQEIDIVTDFGSGHNAFREDVNFKMSSILQEVTPMTSEGSTQLNLTDEKIIYTIETIKQEIECVPDICKEDINITVPQVLSEPEVVCNSFIESEQAFLTQEVNEDIESKKVIDANSDRILELYTECYVCKRMIRKTYIKRHVKRHIIPLEKCNVCKESFFSLKNHQSSGYECVYCKKTFCKLSYLKIHLSKYSKKPVNLNILHNQSRMRISPNKCCPMCNQDISEFCLMYHLNKMNSFVYECIYCKKTFSNVTSLRKHLISHKLSCQICNKSFSTHIEVRNHVKTHNIPKSKSESNSTLFACEFCSKSFKQKSCLTSHITRLHRPEELRFNCDKCSAKYLFQQQLREHMKVHYKEDCVNCEYCNMACRKSYLRIHHRRKHSKKPLQCEICKTRFIRKRLLDSHSCVQIVIGSYKCKFCNRDFKTSDQVINFMKLHPNVQPHTCHICTGSVDMCNEIKDHIEKYHYKPLICDICSKSFSKRVYMRRHLMRHVRCMYGELPNRKNFNYNNIKHIFDDYKIN